MFKSLLFKSITLLFAGSMLLLANNVLNARPEIPDREADGFASKDGYNGGNVQEYWHVGPPDETIYRDPVNGGIVVVKGHCESEGLPKVPTGLGFSWDSVTWAEEVMHNLFICYNAADAPLGFMYTPGRNPILPKIGIFTTNNLKIASEVDAICNVYDVMGTCVVKDLQLKGDNALNVVNFNFSSIKPYYIVITKNGAIIETKSVYFKE